MNKYPKNYKDVGYYVPGKKKRITGSTKATSDFLALVHLDRPDLTISQMRELITDKTKFILDPEAVAVLDTYIEAGYGNLIPNWEY